jgi:hypothetical protein
MCMHPPPPPSPQVDPLPPSRPAAESYLDMTYPFTSNPSLRQQVCVLPYLL